MNDFVMTEEPRFADGGADSPAAILLRSARTDKAPKDSKDRVRAMLGLVDTANEINDSPLRTPSLPNRARDERAKRSRPSQKTIAKFVPFQHLLSAPKPISARKFGGITIAVVQVATILAALFVRPVPRVDPVVAAVAPRHDEPELSLYVVKTPLQETANAPVQLPENTAKFSNVRKYGVGTAISSRSAQAAGRMPLVESIVGAEQAGTLTLNENLAAKQIAASALESSAVSATVVTNPMVFQDGMTQPVRIAGIDPSYPQVARLRGVKGTVIMRCVLTEKGLAQNCKVLKAPAYLEEAVLSVASTWRFTPVTWQGQAVPVNYVFKINFKLG